MSVEAMKQALEALQRCEGRSKADEGDRHRAITALRQAIEQAEKQDVEQSSTESKVSFDQPVARVAEVHMGRYTLEWTNGPLPEGAELYTAPQPQEEHHAKDCALLQIPSRDCDCSQNQEPVAEVAGRFGNMHIKFLPAGMFLQPGDPLYPAPPQREWVGLTKEDIAALLSTHYMYMEDFVVAVDAKIKEKNGWTS